MLSMKNQILFVFRKALLQFVKSINFSRPIENLSIKKTKNAKPQCLYRSFAVFKPRSRCDYMFQFASFWLKYAICGLK